MSRRAYLGLHFIPPASRAATATSSSSSPASATNASTSTRSGRWPKAAAELTFSHYCCRRWDRF